MVAEGIFPTVLRPTVNWERCVVLVVRHVFQNTEAPPHMAQKILKIGVIMLVFMLPLIHIASPEESFHYVSSTLDYIVRNNRRYASTHTFSSMILLVFLPSGN